MDAATNTLMGPAMRDKAWENPETSQETTESDSFPLFMVGLSMVLAVVPLVLSVALSALILGGGEVPQYLAFFTADQAEARQMPVQPTLPAPATLSGTEDAMIADLEAPSPVLQTPREPDASTTSDDGNFQDYPAQGIEVRWPTDNLASQADSHAPTPNEISEGVAEVGQEASKRPSATTGVAPVSEVSGSPEVSEASQAPAGPVNAGHPVADRRPDAGQAEIVVSDYASVTVVTALPQDVVSTPDEAFTPIDLMPLPVAKVTPASLRVNVSTPRGRTPEYKVAETLEVTVSVSEDGFLYCYYQDDGGAVYRVFPNEFQPDAHTRAGQPIVIPGKSAEFDIVFEHARREAELGCVASRDDIDVALSQTLKTDLVPLPVKGIDEVVGAIRRIDPAAAEARLRIRVGT